LLFDALDRGITHFDVAPIYGMGRAEAELSTLLRRHRAAVTVTTKFGIVPTPVGRLAGRAQAPVRMALRRMSRARTSLKQSAAGPADGLGAILYRRSGYTSETVRRSLESSLRQLKTDHVDLFLVHEPEPAYLGRSLDELADLLEEERSRGRIRAWGLAGDPASVLGAMPELGPQVVIQTHEDLASTIPAGTRTHPLITFGALSRVLPQILEAVSVRPELASAWSGRLGGAPTPTRLASLMIRHAVESNAEGVTLYSTSTPEHLATVTGRIGDPLSEDERAVLAEMRQVVTSEQTDGNRR
jgi:D-threo-aldose 1-dehydrogenase